MNIYKVNFWNGFDEDYHEENFIIAAKSEDSASDIAFTLTDAFCKSETFITTEEITKTDNGIEITTK